MGFLSAARKDDFQLARQYLNTRLGDKAAEDLARQLFVVLDARLPARLAHLSDDPAGSRANPLAPDRDVIGTIAGDAGDVEIVVERVERARWGSVWLFSARTLEAVPGLYQQTAERRANWILPGFLLEKRVGGLPVFEWLAVLLGIPALYLAIALLNRLLTPLMRVVWRRVFKESSLVWRDALPAPARLLLLALLSRWLLSSLPLSLLARQFWTSLTTLIAIVAVTWLLMRLNKEVEEYACGRLHPSNTAAVSLLRVGRRAVDVLVLFIALLTLLRRFGVDPTPALAGLGVGGIAVALAAQKTLENVIAGASLIFDQAVRVGDFLKMGDIQGTVDHIGLRSTRIRTLDRTVVSVPNSQIANASLETLSARDKYWFHPMVGLRYETTPEQLHAVVDGIRQLLERHPLIDAASVRVRLLRLGAFSLDVEIFSYLYARDWNHFLEIQEQLLFGVTEIVNLAGTRIAFPSQTMYVAGAQGSLPAAGAFPGR
jgi:MscS family membrane protein